MEEAGPAADGNGEPAIHPRRIVDHEGAAGKRGSGTIPGFHPGVAAKVDTLKIQQMDFSAVELAAAEDARNRQRHPSFRQ